MDFCRVVSLFKENRPWYSLTKRRLWTFTNLLNLIKQYPGGLTETIITCSLDLIKDQSEKSILISWGHLSEIDEKSNTIEWIFKCKIKEINKEILTLSQDNTPVEMYLHSKFLSNIPPNFLVNVFILLIVENCWIY